MLLRHATALHEEMVKFCAIVQKAGRPDLVMELNAGVGGVGEAVKRLAVTSQKLEQNFYFNNTIVYQRKKMLHPVQTSKKENYDNRASDAVKAG